MRAKAVKVTEEDVIQPDKKRRGRPLAKNAVVAVAKKVDEPVKKKRGRPGVKNIAEVVIEEEPQKRKRGRPAKVQVEEEKVTPGEKKFGKIPYGRAVLMPEAKLDESDEGKLCESLVACYGLFACILHLCENKHCQYVKSNRDKFFKITDDVQMRYGYSEYGMSHIIRKDNK